MMKRFLLTPERKHNMKIKDKVKALVWHNGYMIDVDAIIVDVDINMVCLAYIVCGKKLWGWVPRLAVQES